jgi:hypothetical protein
MGAFASATKNYISKCQKIPSLRYKGEYASATKKLYFEMSKKI